MTNLNVKLSVNELDEINKKIEQIQDELSKLQDKKIELEISIHNLLLELHGDREPFKISKFIVGDKLVEVSDGNVKLHNFITLAK